jgi:hypothetical protein
LSRATIKSDVCKVDRVAHMCTLATWEAEIGGSLLEAKQKHETLSEKQTKSKKTRCGSNYTQCLLSKRNTLSSIPSITTHTHTHTHTQK